MATFPTIKFSHNGLDAYKLNGNFQLESQFESEVYEHTRSIILDRVWL